MRCQGDVVGDVSVQSMCGPQSHIDAFDVNISGGPMRHERDGVRQVSWHVGVCRASMWRDCDYAAMSVQCASAMCMLL